MSALIVCFLLSVVIAGYLILPHLNSNPSQLEKAEVSHSLQGALDDKERLLQTLRDIEFDHASGKITEKDYSESRQEVVQQLGTVLERVDSEDKSA